MSNPDIPPQDTPGFRQRLAEHAQGPMGLASIGRELRYAVTDIRQKLVEEGMYGRAVTPPFKAGGGGIHGPAATDDKIRETTLSEQFRARCGEAFDQRAKDLPDHGMLVPDRS